MICRIILSFILLILFHQSSFGQETPITFKSVKNQPYFMSAETTIDSMEYDTLVLNIEAQKNTRARLLWVSVYDTQFNQQKSIWFSLKAGKHDYYINIPSQNPNWLSWIKGFLILPETNPKYIKINQAEIIKGNILTNIKSGWQEFWGPKGRVVTGSTINVIPSSSIFGKSIYIYIYWIAAIFFILLLGIKFIQTKDFFKALQETGRQTFILILIFWVFLALNSSFNFFNIFKENYTKYFGKTIEQKRSAAYGKEYYDFLAFAREKLPQQPVKFGLLSSVYAGSLQARIYLVPHILTENPENDYPYLLIYHPDPKQAPDWNKYKLFAKLKKSEYILKRIK